MGFWLVLLRFDGLSITLEIFWSYVAFPCTDEVYVNGFGPIVRTSFWADESGLTSVSLIPKVTLTDSNSFHPTHSIFVQFPS